MSLKQGGEGFSPFRCAVLDHSKGIDLEWFFLKVEDTDQVNCCYLEAFVTSIFAVQFNYLVLALHSSSPSSVVMRHRTHRVSGRDRKVERLRMTERLIESDAA